MSRIAVKSDITGTVWKIAVEVGASVSEGDTLMVLESMKMEIPVLSTDGGTVAEILVKEEEPVSEGQELVLLET